MVFCEGVLRQEIKRGIRGAIYRQPGNLGYVVLMSQCDHYFEHNQEYAVAGQYEVSVREESELTVMNTGDDALVCLLQI